MKTRLVATGVVVLVIGIALIAVGRYGLTGSTTTIKTFSQPAEGEYVSTELVMNTSSTVVVRSPATVGGMIDARSIDLVNSANINSFVVPYNSSLAGSETYVGLKGDFYYVVFSSAKPDTTIVVANSLAKTVVYGLLAVVGFVCFVAGVVVAIVGLRKKNPPTSAADSEAEYYAKRDGSQ